MNARFGVCQRPEDGLVTVQFERRVALLCERLREVVTELLYTMSGNGLFHFTIFLLVPCAAWSITYLASGAEPHEMFPAPYWRADLW